MNDYAQKARRAARSLRRKLGGRREAELEAELQATRRKLRQTRTELKRARAQLDSGLPAHVERAIAQARAEHLTYLKAANLRELAPVVVELERAQRPGLIIEAGTALGGSAIVLAAAKARRPADEGLRRLRDDPAADRADGDDVHERYEKIAGGEARGVGGETYYGYRDDLYGEVTDSFARLGVPVDEHSVELVQGLFEDTIDLDEPVAFAHLDGDWYESTMTCLERIAPLLVPGGRIVLDDY